MSLFDAIFNPSGGVKDLSTEVKPKTETTVNFEQQVEFVHGKPYTGTRDFCDVEVCKHCYYIDDLWRRFLCCKNCGEPKNVIKLTARYDHGLKQWIWSSYSLRKLQEMNLITVKVINP